MTDSGIQTPRDGKEANGEARSGKTRRLGVLGTLVWDQIYQAGGGETPVAEWGGISYAMEALSVVLPDGWEMRPILKLGEDLYERAMAYLATIPRVLLGPSLMRVPYRNYQVELRYLDEYRRRERLFGDVPPWTWAELEPHLEDIDALYLNFITGLEMGVETARNLPVQVQAPLYADLHSLFQGLTDDGRRYPRELPEWETWLASFDAVQMNEDEFDLLGRALGDPWALADATVGPAPKLLTVTLGSSGAGFVRAPEFANGPASWPGSRDGEKTGVASQIGTVPQKEDAVSGDPTGCGDVWGATFFARLLGGDSLEQAMERANRLAAKKVEHSGARGLRHHLGETLNPGG
jgi:hypothetical protein